MRKKANRINDQREKWLAKNAMEMLKPKKEGFFAPCKITIYAQSLTHCKKDQNCQKKCFFKKKDERTDNQTDRQTEKGREKVKSYSANK